MKIAFIVDPLDEFKTYKDSTYAMMREAAARSHELYVMQQQDMMWRDSVVIARAQLLTLSNQLDPWYRVNDSEEIALKDFDAILMRKDPPFDMEYLYSTYLLGLAQEQGARVFNDARAIRDCNEKLTIARCKFTRHARAAGRQIAAGFAGFRDPRKSVWHRPAGNHQYAFIAVANRRDVTLGHHRPPAVVRNGLNDDIDVRILRIYPEYRCSTHAVERFQDGVAV